NAVLHQCIRPLVGARAPGHHGYQRACDLITGEPQRAVWVTSVRMRREDRSPISSHPLEDLGGLEAAGSHHCVLIGGCERFPRLEVRTTNKAAPGDAR